MLERLNFGWSAGATAAPLLFMPFLHRRVCGLCFSRFRDVFIAADLGDGAGEAPRQLRPTSAQSAQTKDLGSLLPLVILSVCAVGVEGSLSGWLTTYSHRAGRAGVGEAGLGGAAIATSLFWGESC